MSTGRFHNREHVCLDKYCYDLSGEYWSQSGHKALKMFSTFFNYVSYSHFLQHKYFHYYSIVFFQSSVLLNFFIPSFLSHFFASFLPPILSSFLSHFIILFFSVTLSLSLSFFHSLPLCDSLSQHPTLFTNFTIALPLSLSVEGEYQRI